MAKKNKSTNVEGSETSGSAPPSTTSSAPSNNGDHSTYSLNICRNKHWRYISSFHGPWLQLPPEVLESLAHSNYFSPRPHPIDPALFYDLVKIRRNVDDATNLAVRAASGLTSAAMNNSMDSRHGMLGGAAALGLGYGGGGTGKMSREAKHRMRMNATQKLSEAYRLDEVAASVATMQGTSTLEDVAQHVLKRQQVNIDAKYVHFFHEKIPSRMMAEYTPLDPLNEVVAERPTDGSTFRTRALTRIFKDDFVGAASDFTEGLSIARYWAAQHQKGKDQLVLLKQAQEQWGGDWRREAKVDEKDQPDSLESQILFHRAGVYFTLACQYMPGALQGLKEYDATQKRNETSFPDGVESIPLSDAEKDGHKRRLEARKNLRTNAKRALRDYNAFLSRLEYTPGISRNDQDEFMMRFNQASGGGEANGHESFDALSHEFLHTLSNGNNSSSSALVRKKSAHQTNGHTKWPRMPAPKIFKLSELFSPSLPTGLPPFPAEIASLTHESTFKPSLFPETAELVTYHPLLTDALHSLLLCHTLLQTPPKELLRHAHNVARISRLCDGYPIFLPARSPARADWIEVLRRTNNWIGITESWEALCKPAPLPNNAPTKSKDLVSANGTTRKTPPPETPEQKRERQKHEAILEALADERVVDEDSFQRAVQARERRTRADEVLDQQAAASTSSSSAAQSPAPKRWAQEDSKEYPISTERADAIARWVREAPLTVEGAGKSKKRSKAKGKRKKVGLEDSVATLSVDDDVREEDVD